MLFLFPVSPLFYKDTTYIVWFSICFVHTSAGMISTTNRCIAPPFSIIYPSHTLVVSKYKHKQSSTWTKTLEDEVDRRLDGFVQEMVAAGIKFQSFAEEWVLLDRELEYNCNMSSNGPIYSLSDSTCPEQKHCDEGDFQWQHTRGTAQTTLSVYPRRQQLNTRTEIWDAGGWVHWLPRE